MTEATKKSALTPLQAMLEMKRVVEQRLLANEDYVKWLALDTALRAHEHQAKAPSHG